MVNAAPTLPMSNMISDAEWLDFPTSPIFRNSPTNLIPFASFVSKGIYIPPTPSPSPAFEPSPEDTEDIFDSQIETDGDHHPTMNLKVVHDPNAIRCGRSTNAMVMKIPKADAWKLGKEGVEWAEPRKTSRGEFKADKPPFHRALRALTQFFNSRSLALNKQHYYVSSRFRNITRLRSTILEPHIPGSYVPDPSKPMTEEEDEATGFIRDMPGTMRVYWRVVMEDAGKGWNYVMAMESFEIFDSFLHYLLFHNIFSKTDEPWLHTSLLETCRLSRHAIKQMSCASMIYDGTINMPTSFQMLAASAWVGTEVDWLEAERKVAENKELGAHFDELRKEVEAMRLEKVEDVEVPGEQEDVVQLDEKWLHGENEGHLVASLPKAEAVAKITSLVTPHDAAAITILKSVALSTCTVVEVTTTPSDSQSFLSIMNANKPGGYVQLKLSGPAIVDEYGDPIVIIVERAGAIKADEDLQALIGMRIEGRWTKVGLRLGDIEGAQEVPTWIVGGLRRVCPCI